MNQNITVWDYQEKAGDNYDRILINFDFNKKGETKIKKWLEKEHPNVSFDPDFTPSALAYLQYYPETDHIECCMNLMDLCTTPINIPIEDSMLDKRIFDKCLKLAREYINNLKE